MDRLDTKLRRTGGMTLVEVMIAVVLLAFGLLTMLALQVHAMRGSQLGRHYTDAAQVALAETELLQNLDFDAMALTNWTPPDVKPVRMVKVDGAGDATEQLFTVSYRITGNDDMKIIDVRVTWYEGNDDPDNPPRRRFAMTTARFNDEDEDVI
jgi:Tfp pilus assembly protein PilV